MRALTHSTNSRVILNSIEVKNLFLMRIVDDFYTENPEYVKLRNVIPVDNAGNS